MEDSGKKHRSDLFWYVVIGLIVLLGIAAFELFDCDADRVPA